MTLSITGDAIIPCKAITLFRLSSLVFEKNLLTTAFKDESHTKILFIKKIGWENASFKELLES